MEITSNKIQHLMISFWIKKKARHEKPHPLTCAQKNLAYLH